MDAMIPGLLSYSIFGFCIIDHFTETTEILQQEILSYVNKIAEITHSVVDRYGGAANKNIGDAFLLVWKFKDPNEIREMDMAKSWNNTDICKENQIIVDMAVFSFVKIIAKLNKYEHIIEYNENQ